MTKPMTSQSKSKQYGVFGLVGLQNRKTSTVVRIKCDWLVSYDGAVMM